MTVILPTRIAAALVAAGAVTVLTACSTSVLDLEVGQCVSASADGEEVSSLPIVECSEPHVGEVYALPQLPDGEFPGVEAVGTQSDELCLGQAFQDYVGVSFEQSEFAVQTLVPTEQTWSGGDREVVCMLANQDASTNTGTLRNASR